MKEVVKENTEEKKMKKQEDEKDVKKEEKVEAKKFEKAKGKAKKVKKTVENMSEGKKKRKWVIPVVILAILVITMMFASTIFALLNLNNEKIISGVSIVGIDVSGLTKEEAKAKITEVYQPKKETEITIEYEDFETTINPTVIEVDYKVEEAVEEAFLTGRGENIFVNNYQILSTLFGKKDIPVAMWFNEEVTKQTIEDIGVNLPGILLESSYAVEENELIITKGKAGVVIHTEELLKKVKDNLNTINDKEEVLEIPVEQKEPAPIDIDKIHDEVYTEAKDAYYTKNPFTIYPEVEGIDFNVEEARKLLEEEKEEYVIKLTITKPKITIDKIGSEAFPDQLGTFTTRYDVSDRDRSTNLVIACQKINGKVVLAGETFSYNKALGPRTAAAGYRNGKIYSGGEVVDGIGGGICQISSTLYNTVLMSNLEIVERRNHQFVTSYVPAGRDATVVYGMTDFKFKNTRKYPVRIVATAKNGIATVTMYGIKEENEYTFTFSTKTVASIPFTTKYEEDNSLPAGTEKVKQKGANGLKTETYMTKLLNGKPVSTTLLSRDTYDAMARTVIKGTNTTLTNEPTPPAEVTNPEPEAEPTPPTQPTNPTESPDKKPTESTKPTKPTEN
jgi:vancomycin resistance protein YoaR